jgi:hypothetical protein
MADEAYDSADLDAITDLERSRGWALVAARIQSELQRRQLELETPVGEQATASLRGYIAAIRVMAAIPEILKDEITNALDS